MRSDNHPIQNAENKTLWSFFCNSALVIFEASCRRKVETTDRQPWKQKTLSPSRYSPLETRTFADSSWYCFSGFLQLWSPFVPSSSSVSLLQVSSLDPYFLESLVDLVSFFFPALGSTQELFPIAHHLPFFPHRHQSSYSPCLPPRQRQCSCRSSHCSFHLSVSAQSLVDPPWVPSSPAHTFQRTTNY